MSTGIEWTDDTWNPTTGSIIDLEINSQPEEETLPDTIEHGTFKGYGQHKRRGETPCTPCHDAAKEHWRQDAANRDKSRKSRKPDLKATTNPKPRVATARSTARTSPKKPNGAWVQTDEGRAIVRDNTAHNGANPIGRYLNLLLTLAESQEVPDPALLEKIDKLIGIAL